MDSEETSEYRMPCRYDFIFLLLRNSKTKCFSALRSQKLSLSLNFFSIPILKDNAMNFYEFFKILISDRTAARDLVKTNKQILEIKSNIGETPLQYCVVENEINLVKLLHSWGANLNTQDNFGLTPLMNSIMLNHREMFDDLIENNVDVDLNEHEAHSPTSMPVGGGEPNSI